MANRATIDTNGLLRLLLNDVPDQAQAVQNLLRQDMVFDVADMAITEVVFVLEKVYDFKRGDIATAITRIITDSQFNCNTVMFDHALRLYCAHPALSFVDCCLVCYAELNDAKPLYTFDRKLVSQCGEFAKQIS